MAGCSRPWSARGQSPRRLLVQGGRVGAGSQPRRERLPSEDTASVRSGSCVQAPLPRFSVKAERENDGEMEAQGRGTWRWLVGVEVGARQRSGGDGGEVSPLPGAGMRAKSTEPRLFRTSWPPGPPLGGT